MALPAEGMPVAETGPGLQAGQERAFGQVEHLTPILDQYRLVAVLVGMAFAGAIGFALLAVLASGHAHDPLFLLASVALALGGVFGLWVGYRRIGAGLSQAGNTTRAVLASVHRDALTGVFTRSYFMSALRQSLHHGSGTALGYMLLDMDNLKVLNDDGGHAVGDAALAHLATTISAVMPGAVVGRLGGDEFGIVIPDCANRAVVRRLAEQLLGALDQPFVIAGRPVRLSATIGISMAPADASHVDDLIAKADLALYKGKRAGRRQVVEFDPDMLGDERHRRFVERELRAALLMDELQIYYQPVYGADMRIRSHEALLRWRHSVRGMIPPSQFIGIAEESDLIDKLGEWVLRRACLDLPALGTPVAVNVSPAQLRRLDFSRRLRAVVAEHGVDPAMLMVEVTENVPMVAGAIEQANLDDVRAFGVKVAIDDFGAGHASLQYLRSFAFDTIKIDRTYVANLGGSRIDAMIVEAICDIARSLQVEVIAEGVETEQQFELLRQAGCTAFQGYLLGRPQPLAQPDIVSAA